ncbi:hypothetical protein PSHT_07916, partial [Puccinia striiformis]
MAPCPSLHQFLNQALQLVPMDEANPQTFKLLTLSTKTFRTFTLLPHALDPTFALLRAARRGKSKRTREQLEEDEILQEVLEEEAAIARLTEAAKNQEPVAGTSKRIRLILLYILKIDTTGLAPLPAPSGRLTIMFLSYLPQHMPKLIPSLRIHIFACAARADHSQQPSKVVSSNWAQSFPLSELIPAFNNDPKARFLHLIGNCSTNPSVEPVIGIVNELKLIMSSSDELWDRMGGRQECCDVSSSTVDHDQQTKTIAELISTTAPCQEDVQSLSSTDDSGPLPTGLTDSDEVQKRLVGVPRNVWVSLWCEIHSKDYSKLENLTKDGWIANVKSSINSAILEDHLKKQRKLYKKLNNTTNDDDNNKKIDAEVLLMNDKNKKVTNEGKTDPSSSSGFLDCY